MKPVPMQYALIFFGICIIIYAVASRIKTPNEDPYIYSTRQGVGTRTHKTTGVIEFAGPKGWHKYGEVK